MPLKCVLKMAKMKKMLKMVGFMFRNNGGTFSLRINCL